MTVLLLLVLTWTEQTYGVCWPLVLWYVNASWLTVVQLKLITCLMKE